MNEDTIKVTQLPSAETITQNDLLMIVQNNENKKATSSQFLEMIEGELDNYYDKDEVDDLLEAKANIEDLSSVATSGSYNDLTDKPTIPSISDTYGTSTTNGYSQNYINSNTLNPTGDATTTQSNVSSATITNTLEAPLEIDLKGNTSQTGTPTPSSPIPVNNVSGDNQIVVSDGASDTTTYNIDLPVENLFDKDNINKLSNNYINGTSNVISGSGGGVNCLYIPCKPSTTYTIQKISSKRFGVATSKVVPSAGVSLYNVSTNINTKSYTLTTDSEAKYLIVEYYIGGGSSPDTLTEQQILDSIQIEQGSKANKYTPYGTTPIELNKIGTYQDYIYKENDEWYLHKEIGKIVFDGSEDWRLMNVSQTGDYDFQYGFTNHTWTAVDILYDAKCNYFEYQRNGRPTINKFTIVASGDKVWARFNKDNINDLTTFKTWLSTHNTSVNYVLETATNTEITYTPLIEQLNTLEQAQSKEGTTNINQVNNDLPFILDITAFLDTYDGRYEELKQGIENNKSDISDLEYAFNESKPVVLWENSTPTSDFASTSITMPSDFTTNYNYYEILYFSGTNKARAFSTGKIIVGSGTNLSYDVALEDSATPTIRYREANYNSTNNAITIGNGRQKAYNSTTGTANNGICIPYQILGYK